MVARDGRTMGEYTAAERSANSKLRWSRVADRTAETSAARAAAVDEASRRAARIDGTVALWRAGSTGSRAEKLRRERIAAGMKGRRRTVRAHLRRQVSQGLEALVVLDGDKGMDAQGAYELATALQCARGERLNGLYNRFRLEMSPEIAERREFSRSSGFDVLHPWAFGYVSGMIRDLVSGVPITDHQIARAAAVVDLVGDENADGLTTAAVVERAL